MTESDDDSIRAEETNSDYTLEEIKESDISIQWGYHSKGKDYINHYSRIKIKYKRLAFTWVSALFIGLGFLCLKESDQFESNKLYLIVFLTILCWGGIRSLRYVDINVDHRLMASIFWKLNELEASDLAITKPYTKMALSLHKKWFDPVLLDSTYYAMASLCIGLLGIIGIYLKFDEDKHPYFGLVACGLILISLILWEVWSILRSMFHGASRLKAD